MANINNNNNNKIMERKDIDLIRKKLENLNSKVPEDQEILLFKNENTKLAIIEIKSGAKNALSGKMISQLTNVLDQLYDWPQGRGVLICGHNGTFCSGSDLVSVRETASQEYGFDLASVMQYNLRRLQLLPMFSVALIEGYALGGGAELATAADMRLMTESAKIGFVHIKVGVCCGWGGGARLIQLVGPSRALEMLSSGRLIDAEEALQLGLANAIVYTSNGEGRDGFTTMSTRANSRLLDENGNQNDEDERIVKTSIEGESKIRYEISQNEATTTSTSSTTATTIASLARGKALEFLRQHTIGDLHTIKALKSMVDCARSSPIETALANEAHLFASTWGREPHLKALDCNIKHKQ